MARDVVPAKVIWTHSHAVIHIDAELLRAVGIDQNTFLEVRLEERRVILRPLRGEEVRRAQDRERKLKAAVAPVDTGVAELLARLTPW